MCVDGVCVCEWGESDVLIGVWIGWVERVDW